MSERRAGSDLFIVDNSETEWNVLRYLHDWCGLSESIDIASGYFEIGSLLALNDAWQKVDNIRILMGDEVSKRTKQAFTRDLEEVCGRLNLSIEREKEKNDFLTGVPAIVDAIRTGKITCRVYRKEKFHAKAYITHARQEIVGAFALVGSSNFTYPGITENVELNVQIVGRQVNALQEWYEAYWNDAEEVTEEILRTIERHTREYSPFEVYAKSLQQLFRNSELPPEEWERTQSRMFPVLEKYQRDGYHQLLKITKRHRGAFLCDSVGLGKTFIGLMLIERLIKHERKHVMLLVPKGARGPVWETALRRYLPDISVLDAIDNLCVFNHTDLSREGKYPELFEKMKTWADAIIIDEAHHFRNLGTKGGDGKRRSRYWKFFDIAGGKEMYLLTATPINNSLLDLQHMIELFTQGRPDYFKSYGIHSIPGHFRSMEKRLDDHVSDRSGGEQAAAETNQEEAKEVLLNDHLFRSLVVQRSRAFVKKSQELNGGEHTIFPTREDPKVAKYSVARTYGKLLGMVEKAFNKKKPLFSLAVYYPLAYYKGPDTSIDPWVEGRQRQVVSLIRVQFLKRFESSARAFEASCATLLMKLLAWLEQHCQTNTERDLLDRWKTKHRDILEFIQHRRQELGEEPEEEAEDDLIPPEMLEEVEKLSRDEYKVNEIIGETFFDLNEIADFLEELRKLKPESDDKLQTLINLLKSDPVLRNHKVLIFSEYMTTARYLEQQLRAAGIGGVDEVDGARASVDQRGDVITRFAPYYNGSSTAELSEKGVPETRVLISTDVLSEGLNLQDCTRLINYDLHWNPVRLMQRIGRVDRRLNPDIEARIIADHPEYAAIRRTVAYWNFLPPADLDRLLKLYSRVANKTLRISKVFGIEGKKLLTPDDDYEALRNLNDDYDGTMPPLEKMNLEYQRLLRENPGLAEHLDDLPGRVFSGKAHPSPGSNAVFFCFVIPGQELKAGDVGGEWTEEAGNTKWYLYDLATGDILDDPTRIVDVIRCAPDTPRKHDLPEPTLSEIRAKVERHIRNTSLRQLQAPVGVKPILKAWMEVSS